MKKGFTLIELLIVVAIIAILAAIAVPNFLEAQVRSKVSRARTDMRSVSIGLESYYVDNNQYPASARTGRLISSIGNVNSYILPLNTQLAAIPSFAAQNTATTGNKMGTLTTPVSYMSSYAPDPFMDTKAATFAYFADLSGGYIMWSPGPDADQASYTQLGAPTGTPKVEDTSLKVYTNSVAQPGTTLLSGYNQGYTPASSGGYTYDPTNGTVSAGDVWRVKQ
ncbi:MAG: prepilin-type N-terminal cleavage/methylation domain-containing protein [bacterium]